MLLKSIYNWLKKLRNRLEPPFLSYGILKACRRCVYANRYEKVLIVTDKRGPRVLIYPDGTCYVRTGECIGFDKCGKCFSEEERKALNCRWRRF